MSRKLSTREAEIIQLLNEYGHGTLDLLRTWRTDDSRGALGSLLKRLRKAGFLQSAPLDRQQYYYRLTTKAVRWLRKQGVSSSRSQCRPMRPYRKPERQAFVEFLAPQREAGLRPYRPARDVERFPDIAAYIRSGKSDPLRQKMFYRAGNVVGYFVLDRGLTAFVHRRLQPHVYALLKWSSFRQLLAKNEFRLTIITLSSGRRLELETALAADPPPFPYEILINPAIAALIPQASLAPRSPATETQHVPHPAP